MTEDDPPLLIFHGTKDPLVAIARGAHVEPDPEGRWVADLSPVRGPVLGPFSLRSQALQAEQEWLEANWLAEDLLRHLCASNQCAEDLNLASGLWRRDQ